MGRVRYRLKISQADFDALQQAVLADMPRESGAFALAGISTTEEWVDILVRRPVLVPPELFTVQREYRLEVATQATNGLVALCESNKLGAVICHSHPGDIPYSSSDDHGEERIARALQHAIPSGTPMGSLLFYPGGVRGRIWLPQATRPIPLSEICIIGRVIRRIRLGQTSKPLPIDVDVFDRQIRAFGKEGQEVIQAAKVGIIGAGGTGSPTAEQLTRLGVRDVVLIDPDQFSASNVSRVYGTFARDVRKAKTLAKETAPRKVDLVAQHLKRINPKVRVRAISASVVQDSAARQLLDRDVTFLCTDNHWSRAIVNQIAYQYFIPTINLGARIDADQSAIRGAVGVVDVLRPDLPCLEEKGTVLILKREPSRFFSQLTPHELSLPLA